MPEIKPCPFCRSTAAETTQYINDWGRVVSIVKCTCGAAGPPVKTGPERQARAVRKWNERETD